MLYKVGILEITSDVRSKPLGQKRKRGRPKKLAQCLTRSPRTTVTSPPEQVQDLSVESEATSIDTTPPLMEAEVPLPEADVETPEESETVAELQFCTLCIEDQEEISAQWECPECPDYLCDDCKKAHKKNRLTREHNILTYKAQVTQAHDEETNSKNEVCAPCKEEDENIDAPAMYFCQQCEDYLCEDCRNSHKKIKITRTHSIIEYMNENDGNNNSHIVDDVPEEDSVTKSNDAVQTPDIDPEGGENETEDDTKVDNDAPDIDPKAGKNQTEDDPIIDDDALNIDDGKTPDIAHVVGENVNDAPSNPKPVRKSRVRKDPADVKSKQTYKECDICQKEFNARSLVRHRIENTS